MIVGGVKLQKQICLIPFVCGAGAQLPGTERGPAEIKRRGLQNELASTWRQVAWAEDPEALYSREHELYKNLPPLGTKERRDIVLQACRDVARRVEATVKSGAMPVTIGGDHSMAAGTIAGFARAKDAQGRVGVIWVDAHADINTLETSPSQAYHGMPLAALLGLGDKDFATIGGPVPALRPENIVYIGLRNIDPGERRRISDLGIHTFDMKDIAGRDMTKVFKKALKTLSQNIDYLVLSIDLDAFDPTEAPAVGSPESGGFHRDEVLKALTAMAKERAPDMIEVVEFNPDLSGADKTYALLRDVLKSVLQGENALVTASASLRI